MAAPAIGTLPSAKAASAERAPAERIADIGFRLATAGLAHCPQLIRTLGLTFQHLGQFEAADRAAALRLARFDLGPAVLAVAKGGPAEHADVRRSDVLLAVDGRPVPADPDIDRPFDQALARARSDQIDDLVDVAATQPSVRLLLLRDGRQLPIDVVPQSSCPSRIHLARSDQKNAFADGRHVFVTTGLLGQTKSDEQVAFVLGHEMAHNILHHAAALRAAGVSRGIARVLGKNGELVRSTEREADLLGAKLMLDAGYDLQPVIEFLKSQGGGMEISLLSAHGSTASRIEAIEALMTQSRVSKAEEKRD